MSAYCRCVDILDDVRPLTLRNTITEDDNLGRFRFRVFLEGYNMLGDHICEVLDDFARGLLLATPLV